MTKQEFEELYCKKSGITKEWYDKYFVTLPCYCENEDCKGWACVGNSPFAIKIHNELCGKG